MEESSKISVPTQVVQPKVRIVCRVLTAAVSCTCHNHVLSLPVVLAEEYSGVYILDFALNFTGGSFFSASSSFTIDKLDVSIDHPDNVEWSIDGSIFIQSDNNAGTVTHLTPDRNVTRIATTKNHGER